MTSKSGSTRAPRVVADLMRRPVVTISPDASVQELARVLLRSGISGVPVVDADGTAVGTVSMTDILWLSDRLAPLLAGRGRRVRAGQGSADLGSVREIMTPDVFAVEPTTSIQELCEFFARTGLHRALVLERGKPNGIVSITDLIALIVGNGLEDAEG